MNKRRINRFIKTLKATVKAEWFYNPHGEIRCRIDGNEYCPLTALYYARTGKYVSQVYADDAAQKLRYQPDMAKLIITVADGTVHIHHARMDLYDYFAQQLEQLVNDPGEVGFGGTL